MKSMQNSNIEPMEHESLQKQTVTAIQDYMKAIAISKKCPENIASRVSDFMDGWQLEDKIREYPHMAAIILKALTQDNCAKPLKDEAGEWAFNSLADILSKLVEFCIWLDFPEIKAEIYLSYLKQGLVHENVLTRLLQEYHSKIKGINHKN